MPPDRPLHFSPYQVRSDTTGKLTCNMQQKTRHLKEGVMLGLESEVRHACK